MSAETDPIIPYADPASLPEQMRQAIEAYTARMGFLPNALKLYMHRPEILKCLIDLNNTVMRAASSHLDNALKRKIAAVCSALNHSPYCVAHNANTLKSATGGDGEGWSFSDDDVRNLLDPDFEPSDPREAACFAFARAATRDPSDVPQSIIQMLKQVLTPPQIVELACVVGFWKMYNSIHECLYVPIEDELLEADGFNSDELLGEKTERLNRGSKTNGVKVEIYTKQDCSFCRRAKRILEAKGISYVEIVVAANDTKLQEMIERSGGQRTVPQIFVDGDNIAGLDGMLQLARAGLLNKKLGLQ